MAYTLQLGTAKLIILLLLSLTLQNCGKKTLKHPINTDNLLSKIVTDGNLIREITYNPDGLVTSWVWLKRDRTLLERSNFTYSSSHLQRVDFYNYEGQLTKFLSFEYNTDGLLIQTNFHERESPNFAALTPLQLRDYILGLDPLTKFVDTIRKDSKTQLLKPVYVGCGKYSYDASNFVSKIEIFNQRKKQVGYCVFEHDATGNLLNETWYDSDVENSVTCRFEYEYDNKNNVASNLTLPFVLESTFSNNVLRKIGIGLGETESVSYNYIYNDKNYPIQLSKLNSDGEETEVVDYIYKQ